MHGEQEHFLSLICEVLFQLDEKNENNSGANASQILHKKKDEKERQINKKKEKKEKKRKHFLIC